MHEMQFLIKGGAFILILELYIIEKLVKVSQLKPIFNRVKILQQSMFCL
ncbi:hypothetical protein PI23P_05937 [Polaribacter irgensii 23-P]|uniref:Uncharacterized protein n=1 Tax=Polaribacter irgensii 23-P TaxID=313594 RepID=A4BYH4_9FLAO|nr:hypothetical protein PI23P_05937 [Polaribacter irgensii 23-P]